MKHLFLTCLALFWLSTATAQTLTVNEFKTAIADSSVVILDVRTPSEYISGHITGANNISVEGELFTATVERLDRKKSYYVYCGAGVRSAKAAAILREKGFEKVFDLGDGLDAWIENGLPLTTGEKRQ